MRRVISYWPLVLSGLALCSMFTGFFGYRASLWELSTAFMFVRGAALFAIAGMAVAILALAVNRKLGIWNPLAGLILGLSIFLPLWNIKQTAESLPRIHDITTDSVNPPIFAELQKPRIESPNGNEYAGGEIARQQHEAYPDVKSLILEKPVAEVFPRAVAIAHELGWEIVAQDSPGGTIEATVTSFWFGFKDDIVIRLVADGTRTKVDIRSASRVGLSDIGKNAERIRKFLKLVAN